jgi:hypothetical protein
LQSLQLLLGSQRGGLNRWLRIGGLRPRRRGADRQGEPGPRNTETRKRSRRAALLARIREPAVWHIDQSLLEE